MFDFIFIICNLFIFDGINGMRPWCSSCLEKSNALYLRLLGPKATTHSRMHSNSSHLHQRCLIIYLPNFLNVSRADMVTPTVSYQQRPSKPAAVLLIRPCSRVCHSTLSASPYDAYPRTSVRTDYVHVTTPFAHQWRALFNSRFCIFLQILNYAGQIQMLVL